MKASLFVDDIEDVCSELQVVTSEWKVLRVIEVHLIMRWRFARACRFGISDRVAGRATHFRLINFVIPCFPGLSRLINRVRSRTGSPGQRVGTVQLEDISAVAVQVAVLVVPELTSCTISDIR